MVASSTKRRKTSADTESLTKDSAHVHSKMDKRRYDCMMNQRRYRERKKNKTQNTEWYVDELRRETRRLEEHAALLKSNVLMRNIQAGTYRCRSVSTYMSLFQNGLARVPGHLLNQQIDIMASLLAENVLLNGSVGAQGLRQQWEAFNEFFPQLTMKVLDMQSLGDDHAVVVVDAVVDLLFTQHTIACLFPHVAHRSDLVDKLVDRTISCPLRMSFVFGDAQVESMEVDLNFVLGLRPYLGSLDNTMLVVHGSDDDHARITAQGMIAVEAILSTQVGTHELVPTPIKVDMVKQPLLVPLKSDAVHTLRYMTDSLPLPQLSAKERAEQRRLECVLNQRRYRARKKEQYEKTVADMANTKHEIRRLQELATILQNKHITRHVQAGHYRHDAIASYVAMFQHGLALKDDAMFDKQMQVLSGVMSQNLLFNGEVGIPSLVAQWRAGGMLFNRVEMRTLELQVHGADHNVVAVTGTMQAAIGRQTIAALFPHVFKREDVVQKLIASGLFCELRMSFLFDDDRVSIMDSEINFMSGLYHALRNIEDMSFVAHAEGGSKMLSDGTILYNDVAPVDSFVEPIPASVASELMDDCKPKDEPEASKTKASVDFILA
ncbi:hypothetical protein ACHHYP_01243 [Achlya hypogyna]|uniref:BZIP domain-containing protein n=1 Tax=Achlya hypogyna TaxID=1202772 RepID=A0A1V9Z963_ACHHY|nr:hypothetical protein ACHHYP_01243 [Achlya hypogyna]